MMNHDADEPYWSSMDRVYLDRVYPADRPDWFSMRDLAQTLKGMCIQEMRFHIDDVDFPLTDPHLCAVFLEALKNITPLPGGFLNQVDSVEITYTDSDNVLSYASLSFCAGDAPGTIGKSFCDALLEFGGFLACAVRTFVAENDTDIVEVKLFDIHITARDEVARISNILKQIDATAFAFTTRNWGPDITLYTRNNPPETFKMKADMSLSNDLRDLVQMYAAQYQAQKKTK